MQTLIVCAMVVLTVVAAAVWVVDRLDFVVREIVARAIEIERGRNADIRSEIETLRSLVTEQNDLIRDSRFYVLPRTEQLKILYEMATPIVLDTIREWEPGQHQLMIEKSIEYPSDEFSYELIEYKNGHIVETDQPRETRRVVGSLIFNGKESPFSFEVGETDNSSSFGAGRLRVVYDGYRYAAFLRDAILYPRVKQ
ncbi:MAG: hypothetical protein AB7N70_09560 [Dehalococcoidia bacterium]